MPRTAAAIFAVLTAFLWFSPALCAVGRTRQQLNYRPIIGKIWSHERLYLVSTGPRRSRLYTWIVEGSYVILVWNVREKVCYTDWGVSEEGDVFPVDWFTRCYIEILCF